MIDRELAGQSTEIKWSSLNTARIRAFVDLRVRRNLRPVYTTVAVDHFDSGTYSQQHPGAWGQRSLHVLIYINLAVFHFSWVAHGGTDSTTTTITTSPPSLPPLFGRTPHHETLPLWARWPQEWWWWLAG
ncbi:hypothetical protein E2C01_080610 [Portunus trituberculatus]|uniref:Uncharacterized protein n=1 Tax=Portunus trituberculatus TaxID=210409 RepID=A0A5B7IPN2_PORTR|nr:hypothetical protein [Portunus trituberculatus]